MKGLENLSSVMWLDLANNEIGSLEGLPAFVSAREGFMPPELNLRNNNISDLTGIAGAANLDTLVLGGNAVTDLNPLSTLTSLQDLRLDDNAITDLTPLASLSNLVWLDIHANQVADLSPLAGLANLRVLYANDNLISDLTPMEDFFNRPPVPWYYGDSGSSWTLANNRITDISFLDWATVGQAWSAAPWDASEYDDGLSVLEYAVTDQSVTTTAVAGTTVALPVVKTAAGSPNAVKWTVVSGDATINAAAGTVTYDTAGPVMLGWADEFDVAGRTSCVTDPVTLETTCGAGPAVTVSFFSGAVSVNVVDAGSLPDPSVPDSAAVKDVVDAVTTGGAARVADGKDSYTLTTTVRSADGVALTGFASRLTASAASGVVVSGFTDMGDGTYALSVPSATPGLSEVVVRLDGSPVGAPIPVNFIAATVVSASRVAGEAESATGLGFLPGEKVTVTVHSEPIVLGVFTADATGSVPVSFTLPKDFPVGRHTVEFVGETSGTIVVGFDVVAPKVPFPTGGVAEAGSSLPMAGVLGLMLIGAAGVALTAGVRRYN